jgi:hypothetical protein
VILFLAIVRKPFVASAQRQGDRVAPPLAAAAEPATAG